MHDLEEVLKNRCRGEIFVETGTCNGRTVELVLSHGARAVRSVEGSKEAYKRCKSKFAGDNRVKLWNGFSSDLLWEMIHDVNEKMIFFLDAHPCGPGSYGHEEIETGIKRFTQENILQEEIEIISRHPIKTHTIIVDDQHNHDRGLRGIEDYKEKLLKINPNYQFSISMKQPSGPTDTACCLIAEIV